MPGTTTHDIPIDTDALVIGAGPVGLFQVFQLGLLELHAEVVDVLPHPGGQCVALYGDKPIYDIPGLPVCSGQELTERLLTQIRPFSAGFHFGQQVTTLQPLPDGRFELHTSAGTVFRARTVFIAAGVGAFLPRGLPVPGLEAFRGTQLFEGGLPDPLIHPAATLPGPWVVTGQDDSALACALEGVTRGHAVTLIHRRDHFLAADELQAAVQVARSQGRLQFIAGQVIGWEEAAAETQSTPRRLTHVKVATQGGTTQTVQVGTLLACLGLAPQLGVLAQWGLALSRKQLVVDPAHFETSVPGIFAVGDVNSYPGKKKLILCGFHEATLAAHRAAEFLRPGQAPGPLLYTTSSPKLQRLLGVASDTENR